MNACASRGGVDHIDEASEIFYEDGGRDGEAGHADVADFGGYDGGTDGAVGGGGVGFDEDLDFHSSMWCVCQGSRPLVNVVTPLRGSFGIDQWRDERDGQTCIARRCTAQRFFP